jgi:predicted small metal-binding protein
MPYVCDCLDLGYVDRWHAQADSKADVMQLLTAHLAEKHGISTVSSTLSSYLERSVRKVDAPEEQSGRAPRARALMEGPAQAWSWFEDLFRTDATRSTD